MPAMAIEITGEAKEFDEKTGVDMAVVKEIKIENGTEIVYLNSAPKEENKRETPQE